jgi:PIN domain nuclease of toxin-antitoxin system
VNAVLLDTCAVIWYAEGRLPRAVVELLTEPVASGAVFFSPISAWEIGTLGRPRRDGPRVRFDPNPAAWFDRFRAGPGLQEARLSATIAMEAALLPGDPHGDPADRLLIATARTRGIPLLTSDRRIIAYAAQGYLDVVACYPEGPSPS